uniref:Uncharacterized protein n=1 Tax=Candidatus Kentrum sp. LPFa TaxID=2126335 RepID=A0A450WYC4_9GAMM|nr:MAG: hypothetical protein BECKLPF1236A_GA0070988_103291 [Candidatus Kentron sp. LPFa]VFK26313.1 MAG: hypothetical protein BECKLPF1236C_GA0070990_1003321 [Candidatus Kentron sp. LPFa]
MVGAEVVVIAEGQTEEQFIKQVVAPALRPLAIYLKPRLLPKGGAVSFDRLKRHARNTLTFMKKAPITPENERSYWGDRGARSIKSLAIQS